MGSDFWTPSPYLSPCPRIPPRGRYEVEPFFSFLFLSFFLYVLTSVEGSVPVCCTIQFMTTRCFQAIMQTAIEINLPMFPLPKVNDIIYTHALNWETYWWLSVIDTILDTMWLVKVFVVPSLWHDHDQSLSNKIGATMSIILIKEGTSLSKMLEEFSTSFLYLALFKSRSI